MLYQVVEKLWYDNHSLRWVLYPFSLLFFVISRFRRFILIRFLQQTSDIPIIVIGNLTVGGVGKTPLVIEVAKVLKQKGLQVGIVSRGYGATTRDYPYLVGPDDTASLVGDEPKLIAEKSRCPVMIAPDRNMAVKALVDEHGCQVIISDDGLQHYKMARALEIVVIDGKRGLGNELLLPAGPLREPLSRLKSVDLIVVNSGDWPEAYNMSLKPGLPTYIHSGVSVPLASISKPVAAVAGIGNPIRFFDTLDALGITFKPYPFPDHFEYQKEHFNFSEQIVLMTEKDAVKCRPFAEKNMMYLPVDVQIDATFWDGLWKHPALKDLF